MKIQIGGQSEGVTVAVDQPKVGPEGWFGSEVAVRVGAWSGRYTAQFLIDDLAGFADALTLLTEFPSTAVLSSTDGYLDVRLTRDELGKVAVSGEAWDRPRWGAHLEFSFEIDQTHLQPILASVQAILRQLRT